MKYDFSTYDLNYFWRKSKNRNDYIISHHKKIKFQDSLASIAYALGSINNYWELENLFNIPKFKSLEFFGNTGCNHLPLDFETTCTDSIILPISLKNQLRKIYQCKKRQPQKIVDMGCGVGELGVCFSHLEINNVMYDMQLSLFDDYIKVKNLFEIRKEFTTLVDSFNKINWEYVDTVIFCSSIEHFYEEDFNKILPIIESQLKKTKGRLIITNSIFNHPIEIRRDHVFKIDDNVFDLISDRAQNVFYREGSHLVLDY